MGHTHGTAWTDELIESMIIECKDGMGIARMPSRAEIKSYFGDDCLTNKISKTYGYYGWAERLGLSMKGSDTQTGKIGERFARKWLEEHGLDVQQMTTNYPYDLYVNGCVKVDVKYSHLYSPKGASFAFYSFRLGKEIPTCDIYLLIAQDKENTRRYFVVPSREAQQKQISIGEKKSVYYKYENRIDIILDYEAAFKNIA